MRGSPKQAAWAERIKTAAIVAFDLHISRLKGQGISHQFLDWAIIIRNCACNNNEASDWIEFKEGQIYSIAERALPLYALRERLGWSQEEVHSIGYGVFDKLNEIAF